LVGRVAATDPSGFRTIFGNRQARTCAALIFFLELQAFEQILGVRHKGRCNCWDLLLRKLCADHFHGGRQIRVARDKIRPIKTAFVRVVEQGDSNAHVSFFFLMGCPLALAIETFPALFLEVAHAGTRNPKIVSASCGGHQGDGWGIRKPTQEPKGAVSGDGVAVRLT
jgi:hypothetical protein